MRPVRWGIQLAGAALALLASPAGLALVGGGASPAPGTSAGSSATASPSISPTAAGSGSPALSPRPTSSAPLPSSSAQWLTAQPAPRPAGLARHAGRPRTVALARPARAHKTVVTFTWGGGLADQMPSLPMFATYGMHATYFVPSGLVCVLAQQQCQRSSAYLTLGDIRKIAAAGNEIGGLSVLHQQLTTLPVAEAKREVCDDRANLFRWGFHPTDFAYPFAAVTPAVETLTRACGYNAGLGTGTLRGAGLCLTCAWAESIPPQNPLDVRTPIEVNSVNTTWTAGTYEHDVQEAQLHGGGWVIFTIHDICQQNCPLGTTPAILSKVLSWLAGQQKLGTTSVETMAAVIGGPVRPAVPGPAPRRLHGIGVANARLAASSGSLPACFQAANYGHTVASFTYRPGGGPGGAAAETVRTTRQGSGIAKLLPRMDLGLCAPSVVAGHAYRAGIWYQASSQPQMEIYRRTSLGSWVYWTTSPALPASGSWRHALWQTPAVPAGTTAISFGLAAKSAGTITTTDYSLTAARNYRTLIWIGVLALALAAAGLIGRGHYRYVRYARAEAAEALAVQDAELRS
jgi:peptidoglycan/xylan/chitin deacetylase (PgdA/CDA1 family)